LPFVCGRKICSNLRRCRCVRSEQEALQQKLAQIEKKIIVGGENLLEKAEEQEKLLDESAKELEERRQKAESLRKALEEKEVTRCVIFMNQAVTLLWIARYWPVRLLRILHYWTTVLCETVGLFWLSLYHIELSVLSL